MIKADVQLPSGKKEDSKNITRDDFDGGPVSLDEIETGLWLGNVTAATDINIIKKYNITYILTVDSCPIPSHITQISTLTTKFVQISDMPKEDLLKYFEECIDFIKYALENKHSVLVHCYFGVSRSAAIIIAYIMKTYRINYEQAFQRVKSKRRFVGPNTGFIYQLKLFYKMGYTINTSHEKYKLYRMRLAADSIKKAKILPQSFMDLVKPDPVLVQTRPEPIVYRCKKCRRVVATKSNIIQHKPKDDPINNIDKTLVMDNLTEKLQMNSLNSENSHKSNDSETNLCKQMYFVEPIIWMKEIINNTQGRLNCPKCNSKLGSFSWIMGCQCPCGKQVSPAFYFVPSKVEYSTVVQNVQLITALTSYKYKINLVNKTDAITLLQEFGSPANLIIMFRRKDILIYVSNFDHL